MACKALSQRNDDPIKASRPWDSVCSLSVISIIGSENL